MMDIRPLLLNKDRKYESSKQFPTLLVIMRIYERSWPNEWKSIGEDLSNCLKEYPNVDLMPMGFPDNWMSVLGLE